MKVLNIEMTQACTARVLEAICAKAGLQLASKINHNSSRRPFIYSVNGSPFEPIKQATAKAIFECELGGHWIEEFGIKDRVGYPVFKRVE